MKDVNNTLCNHILLFRKFLYANKDSPAKLNSVSLIYYIETFERIEQKIAFKKDKLKLHFEKWDCIKLVLWKFMYSVKLIDSLQARRRGGEGSWGGQFGRQFGRMVSEEGVCVCI